MAAVYLVVDGAGVPKYVGKTTTTPELRFIRHLQGIDRDDPRTRHIPFRRWLTKHRDEARVLELESGEWTRHELSAREQTWIAHYGLENLLNVTPGGDGGWTTVGSREQALKAWETRRARGTDTWTMSEAQRQGMIGHAPHGSFSVDWRQANPEKEQARIAAVIAANKRRERPKVPRLVVQCKCGCGTELERTESEIRRGRLYVDRAHYLKN